jgi:hypothetical protein
LDRWNKLKEVLCIQTRAEVAKILQMKIKHQIIGEYATKRCFFDLKKLTIVTGS